MHSSRRSSRAFKKRHPRLDETYLAAWDQRIAGPSRAMTSSKRAETPPSLKRLPLLCSAGRNLGARLNKCVSLVAARFTDKSGGILRRFPRYWAGGDRHRRTRRPTGFFFFLAVLDALDYGPNRSTLPRATFLQRFPSMQLHLLDVEPPAPGRLRSQMPSLCTRATLAPFNFMVQRHHHCIRLL
jgi:hypothetical protein